MNTFESEFTMNTLENREDLLTYTLSLLRPLEKCFHRNNTRLHIGNTSSGACDAVSEIEGFSRILWALAAMPELSVDDRIWQIIRQGLVCGTDPDHPDYFGDISNYDQRIVETAAIGYAFVLRPEAIYDPLTEMEKSKLISWLEGVNTHKAYDCNWKFFRVMVNLGFKSLGLNYDQEGMAEYLDELDDYYVSEGWYLDGDVNQAHADYYVPFAMHYYGLFYSWTMKDEDPERSKVYRDRAALFAEDFIYWFDAKGTALPYGRSLTYRFAQVAFWSMMAVTKVETSISTGVIKGLILRHLRWWQEQPYLDSSGHMTIGYAYPNLFMSEEYNAPGSVYWSLKTMVLLLLDEQDEFWQIPEEAMPKLKNHRIQTVPRLVLERDDKGHHLIAYNAGNYHTNGHTHVECKYEKFAYSTYFGFSVPRSHKELRFGAFDSTLAVSVDDRYYRHKEKSEQIEIHETYMRTVWRPYEDVSIDTYLIYGYPWHVRIHRIKSGRNLVVAEGGFALGIECSDGAKQLKEVMDKNFAEVVSTVDYSGIRGVSGYSECHLVRAASNTNLMNSRTIIPTLKGRISRGEAILVSIVYGDQGQYSACRLPKVMVNENRVEIIDGSQVIRVDLPSN